MDFIPPFDLHTFITAPWSDGLSGSIWILLMGFLVNAACGLVGNFLILRRMALVGDAISHSLLPGIAVVFLISNSRSTGLMVTGALAAGLASVWLIEFIHKKTRVKQDAALGVTFTTFFAIGVILISVFADQVDLDLECVLYGEIGWIGFADSWSVFGAEVPIPLLQMGATFLAVLALVIVFYKELLVTSFDSGLATSLGIPASWIHYGLMIMLSLVIVFSFESVGAILVIAMLIMPGATGALLSDRLPHILILSIIFGGFYSLAGIHLAEWLNCSQAGAMVTSGFGLFCLIWITSPRRGLLAQSLKRLRQRSSELSVN
ncbi:metal ABC transporter permease [Opitutia bacterium ISCC 51]|nr:metal ABC transporter permease [Opitutae bacterium ISCC 51]QXD29016.1 metal ABC transporter permease [Opitutae bacterium ISCC 52]